MQIKDMRPESFVKQIRCDRCDRLADVSEAEFQEFVSIDLKAGYASIFGDGNDVQIDLCQHCLKAVLGPWLRVSDPDTDRGVLLKRLSLFDPDRHGGEFPTSVDVSLQKPSDMPVQERLPLNVPSALHLRLASLRAFFGYSARLFFAPLTGSIRGIRKEYQRLERLERVRRLRQSEYMRRGMSANERSEAAGDFIPSETVINKLRAKVEAARKRKTLGVLKGRFDVPADFDAPLPEEVVRDFEGGAGKDSKLTVMARAQNDPAFAEAILDEAIELAASVEPELAKRILHDLAGLCQQPPAANASDVRGNEEPYR